MPETVIRFADYERKSKNPDAAAPRNPADADVIVLPVIRRFNERHREGDYELFLGDNLHL